MESPYYTNSNYTEWSVTGAAIALYRVTVGEKIGRKRGMKFVGKIIEFENLPSILNARSIR